MRRLTSFLIMALLLAGGLLVFSPEEAVVSAANVTNDITGTVTWNNDMTVKNDITITGTGDLTIKKGVTINMDLGTTIYVDGKLTIEGTDLQKVRFISSLVVPPPAPGDWDRIQINSTATVVINHTVIQHAKDGLKFQKCSNMHFPEPIYSKDCRHSGVWLNASDRINFDRLECTTTFSGAMSNAGLFLDNGTNSTIANSTFSGFSWAGINAQNGSNFNNITNCTFMNNGQWMDGGGIVIEDGDILLEPCMGNHINNNTIWNNMWGVMMFETQHPNKICNNTIWDCNGQFHPLFPNSGIILYNADQQLVEYNTISSCNDGIRVDSENLWSTNLVFKNEIDSCAFGLNITGAMGDSFINNTIMSCDTALRADRNTFMWTDSRNLIIEGNHLSWGHAGIDLVNSDNAVIDKNVVLGFSIPIEMQSTCAGNVMWGNYFYQQDDGWQCAYDHEITGTNAWFNNLYNDYSGRDTNGDGFGDTSVYMISGAGFSTDPNPLCVVMTDANSTWRYPSISEALMWTNWGDHIYVPYGLYIWNCNINQETTVEGIPWEVIEPVMPSVLQFKQGFMGGGAYDFSIINISVAAAPHSLQAWSGESHEIYLKNFQTIACDWGLAIEEYRVEMHDCEVDMHDTPTWEGLKFNRYFAGGYSLPKAFNGDHAMYSGTNLWYDQYSNMTLDLTSTVNGDTIDLSFMHWYIFDPGEFTGRVEYFSGGQWHVLKPKNGHPKYMGYPANGTMNDNNGSWDGNRPGYTGASEGSFNEPVWQYEVFSLDKLYGQKVDVRWVIYNAMGGMDIKTPGWLIDNISVIVNSATELYNEDFESGYMGPEWWNGGFHVKDLDMPPSEIHGLEVSNCQNFGAEFFATDIIVDDAYFHDNNENLFFKQWGGTHSTGSLTLIDSLLRDPNLGNPNLVVDGAFDVHIEGCEFYNAMTNIELLGVYNSEIYDSYFQNVSWRHIGLSNAFNVLIENNTFLDSEDQMISGEGFVTDIVNNTFYNNTNTFIELNQNDHQNMKALYENMESIDTKLNWFSGRGEYIRNALYTPSFQLWNPGGNNNMQLNLTHLYGALYEEDACQVFIVENGVETLLHTMSYDSWARAIGEYDDVMAFTGKDDPGWQTAMFDLSDWYLHTVQFKFVYTTGNYGCESLGWTIAGVEIPGINYYQWFQGTDGGYTGVGWEAEGIFEPTINIEGNEIDYNSGSGSAILVNCALNTGYDNLYMSNNVERNSITNISGGAVRIEGFDAGSKALLMAYDNYIYNCLSGFYSWIYDFSATIMANNTFYDVGFPIDLYSRDCEAYIFENYINESAKAIDVDADKLQFALVNNTITDISGMGDAIRIYCDGDILDSQFHGNKIYETTQDGSLVNIQSDGYISDMRIQHNTIFDTEGLTFDIWANMNTSINFDNNYLHDNDGRVQIESTKGLIANVTGNTIHNIGNRAIYLDGYDLNASIFSNDISDCAGRGLDLASTNIMILNIQGVDIHRTSFHGIYATAGDVLISYFNDVEVSYINGHGIVLESTDSQLMELNYVRSTHNQNVGIHALSQNGILTGYLSYCNASRNNGYGILLKNTHDFITSLCNISNCNLTGFFVEGSTGYHMVLNSTIENNIGNGVRCDDVDMIVFINSSINKNTLNDFRIKSHTNCSLVNSTFSKAKLAILTGSTFFVRWWIQVNVMNETGAFVHSDLVVKNATNFTEYQREIFNGRFRWLLIADFLQTSDKTDNYNVHELIAAREDGVPGSVKQRVNVTKYSVFDIYVTRAPECFLSGTINMKEDQPMNVFLPGNFTDESPVTYTASSGRNVQVTIGGLTAVLTPKMDWSGMDTIWINATDIWGERTNKLVTVIVDPVNDAPRIIPSIKNMTVSEDGPDWTLDLKPREFDIDTPGNDLYWVVDGYNTSLVDITQDNKVLTFRLKHDAYGNTSIKVHLSDGNAEIVQVVTLTVLAVNDPPKIDPMIEDQQMDEDSEPWSIPLSDHVMDIDDRSEDLMWSFTGGNSALIDIYIENGLLNFKPQKDANGHTVINLTVKDISGASFWQEFNVNLDPVNDGPVIDEIGNQTYDRNKEYNLDLGPFVSDIDNSEEELTVAVDSDYGWVSNFTLFFNYPETVPFNKEKVTLTVFDGQFQAQAEFWVILNDTEGPKKYKISGAVFYGSGGPKDMFEPIVNAKVTLTQGGLDIKTATTDADGLFEFDRIAEGDDYALEVKPSEDDEAIYGQRSGYLEKIQEIRLNRNIDLSIYLEGYTFDPDQMLFTVYGVVQFSGGDKEGEASNVQLSLLNNLGSAIMKINSDADGNYQFQNVPEGVGYTIYAKPDSGDLGVVTSRSGYLDHTSNAFDVSDHVEMNIFLNYYEYVPGQKYYSISGEITFGETRAGGDPVLVKLLKEDKIFKQTWSSLDGEYELLFVPEGDYALEATPLEPGEWGKKTGYLNWSENITIDADLVKDIKLEYHLYVPTAVDDDDDIIVPDDDVVDPNGTDDDIDPNGTVDDDVIDPDTDPKEQQSQLSNLLLLLGIIALLVLVILIVVMFLRNKKLQEDLDEKEHSLKQGGVKTGVVKRKTASSDAEVIEKQDVPDTDAISAEDGSIEIDGEEPSYLPPKEDASPGDAEVEDVEIEDAEVEDAVAIVENDPDMDSPGLVDPGDDGDKTELKGWDL